MRVIHRAGLASIIILVGIKGALAWKSSPKDMARLSCRVQAALASFPHRHFYVVSDDDHLYGLDFYLDGMMTKVAASPVLDPSAAVTPAAQLSRVTAADQARRTVSVIMVQKSELGKVEEFLSNGKTEIKSFVPYRIKPLGGQWMLVISDSGKVPRLSGALVSSRSDLPIPKNHLPWNTKTLRRG